MEVSPQLNFVETDRLLLSRVESSDLSGYCELFQNQQVMAHLGGPDLNNEQSSSRLERHISYWSEQGMGPWAARMQGSCEFIGMGGLQRIEHLGQEEISVGYALLPKHWGCGYASEIAEVACMLGFAHFPVNSIVSITMPGNTGSQRAMKKAGFSFEAKIVHAGLDQLIYRRFRGGVE